MEVFSPLTPTSDQDRISPLNINTISSTKVMRSRKNSNLGNIRLSNKHHNVYVFLRENFSNWLQEINFCDDTRVKWDWMKYKIRQESILYSKSKAKERRKKLQTIENKLKICEKDLAESATQENVAKLEALKAEYEREYDYIVRGSIIRSRATWFEQGERNSKYFLNLENNNKTKSCIRKLLQENGKKSAQTPTPF